MPDLNKCSNDTCALRSQCLRFTSEADPKARVIPKYKPVKKGAFWVCDNYWFNGQLRIV